MHIFFLLTLNASVSTSTVCVTNHSIVNEILLNMLANGDETPDSTNLALLSAIAELCPIEGGDAVYEARAIVERLTGETYDDAVICAVEERPSNETARNFQLEQKDVLVFPNPSTGYIYWTVLKEHPTVTVRVFNALGQLVVERETASNSLDLSALSSGVYHLLFTTSDNALRLNKSIVIEKH